MPEYTKPPKEIFETVGVSNLFSLWLQKNYGKHAAEDFSRYLNSQPNAELWCENCGTSYPLLKWGSVLDIQWALKENGKIGPMRITKIGHEAFSNPKAAGIVCESNQCREYNLPLDYLFVGNLRTLALAELETVSLGTKWEIIPEMADKRVFYTTNFSHALGSRQEISVLKYLAKKGLLVQKEFELDKSTSVNAYRINETNIKQLRAIESKLFDDFSLLKQFRDFLTERMKSLEDVLEIHEKPDVSIKHVAPFEMGHDNAKRNAANTYSSEKIVVHVTTESLGKVWKKDHKQYWGEK